MVVRLIPVLCAFACAAQAADTLPDPTRPAIGWNAAAQAEAVPSGPQLQAIRIQGQVRSAMISGETVHIGSKVEQAVVTRIEEDRVWLRGPQGVQLLKLFPEVEKHPPHAQSGKKPPAGPATRKESK